MDSKAELSKNLAVNGAGLLTFGCTFQQKELFFAEILV